MKASTTLLVIALFAVSVVTALAQHSRHSLPVIIADRNLVIATVAGSGVLPLYLSQDWDSPQPAISRVVVTIHGLHRNADTYRATAEKTLAASGIDAKSVLLIEPQFLDEADVAAEQPPTATLRWSHAGWEGGEDADGPAPISSFVALDAILARLADRAVFPALKNVVVAGFSGGGQMVQRYAIAPRGDGVLTAAGIHVRYVVSSPSTYVYFSAERPSGAGFAPGNDAACPNYNRWKYGMTGLPAYFAGQDAAALEAAYVARDVIYLLGTADTDPNHPALDKTCMAEAEGPDRYARGLAYFRYLQRRHPTGLNHRLLQVPGVSHDQRRMFYSACGLAALYDLPGCTGG